MRDRHNWRAEAGALLRLAGPLIVSNLFFTLQITIDRLLLAKYDSAATGAAFAAAMVFYAPFALLSGTASFTATFVAQFVGAGRPREIGPIVAQSMIFSIATGILFGCVAPFSREVIELAGHEANLVDLEARYFFWLCLCGLPMIVTAAISGLFAGLNRPGTVIVVNIVGCVVNGLLDLWWIFGGLSIDAQGIGGAGAATFAGSVASMLVAVVLLYLPELDVDFGTRTLAFDGPLLRKFLSFAFPSGLQSGFDVIAWACFTLLIGRLGPAPLAATSVVMLINAWFYVPMVGLAQAVSVRVGENIGRRRTDQAERAGWAGFAIAGVSMTSLGVLVALVPGVMLSLFESRESPELWRETSEYVPTLLWFVAVYSFFDSANLVFAFALRGAGDTRFVSVATLVAGIVLLLLPGAYVCEFGWGIYWAWVCATLYIGGLAATFLCRFVWGPWRGLSLIDAPTAEHRLASGEFATPMVAVQSDTPQGVR